MARKKIVFVIVEDQRAEKPFYTSEAIYTASPSRIAERNRRKKETVDRICTLHKVWGKIPYHVYYMSLHLDHVLYDKQNSTDEEKERDAYLFAKYYKDRLGDFLEFISHSDFSVAGDYKASWDYIKEGLHSLERHTNLGICFEGCLYESDRRP